MWVVFVASISILHNGRICRFKNVALCKLGLGIENDTHHINYSAA